MTTDNKAANSIFNEMGGERSIAIGMTFYWVRDKYDKINSIYSGKRERINSGLCHETTPDLAP